MQDIDWETAINTRRSIRSYEMRPLAPDTMSKIRQFAGDMPVPFEHDVMVRFFKAEATKRLYASLITSPPDHAAFMARTDTLSISKAGFIGEMLILYATALGLATCWFGHYSLTELERLMPHLGEHAADHPRWGFGKDFTPGERAICLTPLAYRRKDGLRMYDRIAGAVMSHRRKPLRELLQDGVTEENLSPDVLSALELARKSPSARNGQFWRFTVSPDLGSITVALPAGYRPSLWPHPNVDIGICACHLWLGLKMKGVETGLKLEVDGDRAVWTFTL